MVMEAALIYESGADELLDYVVVVDAPADARIARVAERDEVSREEVAARMRHQLDRDELVRRADFVIRNDGSLDDLRNEVAVMVPKVLGPPPRGGG
jgi:dephospho-CoA kinase